MKHNAQAIRLKEELDNFRPLSKEDEGRVMQKFRLDWNYHSNHLEGNSLTYGETKALILFGITAQGKPLKDHFEITGHDEAVKWIESIVKDERPLTESFIRELHKLLLKASYSNPAITPSGIPAQRQINVGEYKTKPNHVRTKTGEIFRFATPEETPALMDDLIQWYRKKSLEKDINPIILAAEFHYKFIRIHPFDDGNGRTARILMNFILMRFGFPPVIIKTEDKENYFSVLRQADAGILEPFLEYIAENLVRSLEIMISGAKGESIEEEGDFEKEMALLEQKFKQVRSEIPIKRNDDIVVELYESFNKTLFLEFEKKWDFFDKFYISSNHSLTDNVRSKPKSGFKIRTKNKKIKSEKIFKGFNSKNYESVEFSSSIEVNFLEDVYTVETEKEQRIEKKYDETLSKDEISSLVGFETKRHQKFIENILKEIKDNS